MKSFFCGAKLFLENNFVSGYKILVQNGRVIEIQRKDSSFKNSLDDVKNIYEFPESFCLCPGMIDIHLHGLSGVDVMDGTNDSFLKIKSELVKEGVTSFLATTMTAPIIQIKKVMQTAKNVDNSPQNGAELLGMYLEGPFLSPVKKGAQKGDYLIAPSLNVLYDLISQFGTDFIKVIAIAPELENAEEFILQARKEGIICSFAHSAATYEETEKAHACGLDHATHLFNAMNPLTHRHPAGINCLLENDDISIEMIADGLHLDPSILKIVCKIKRSNSIMLITDSMRAKNLSDGIYDLGGQDVIVKNNEARLVDGTIAGSLLHLDDALRNMIKFSGAKLEEIILMTSYNQAKKLKILDKKGQIALGCDADFVVFDNNWKVNKVFCREIAF